MTLGTLALLVRRWRVFWFAEVPPHSSAILRIVVGVLSLISLLGLLPVDMFWSPDGLVPIAGDGLGLRKAVIESGLGPIAGWTFFLASLASFSLMTVGYRTTVAVVACFLANVLLDAWNPLPLNGSHPVTTALLFSLMWTKSGAVLSVDSWLRRRQGKPRQNEAEALQPIWPLRLLRLHIAVIYLNTGLWKLLNLEWRDGSALHYVLHQNTFARFPETLPVALSWLTTVGAYVTLFWELGFALMLFHRRTRQLALVMGVAIHLGMALTIEVGVFGWVMIASYIGFLDPNAVATFVRSLGRRRARTAEAQTAAAPQELDPRPV
jgi:hypothetical protein